MAYFISHFFSSTLKENVTVNVIIPSMDTDELMNKEKTHSYDSQRKFPVLYLLHGAYGDYSDWQRFSSIEKHAQRYQLAVVMASAGNSFYHDMVRGGKYFTFFTEELRRFAAAMFPISGKREDTFAAGLSMGGYGAYYLTLRRSDLYFGAASLSGALDIVNLRKEIKQGKIEGPFPWEDIFLNPDALEGTKSDLFALYKKCRDSNEVPKLYQACGTEDFLYSINQNMRSFLYEMGADFTYEEGPGIHDWNFWDPYIQKVLQWIAINRDESQEDDNGSKS